MSGIYVHIPFCKQACNYCNFHFSTQLKNKELLVQMIVKELELRADYLTEKALTSIYFGGGTPSLLNDRELGMIMDAIADKFTISPTTEITLEANPDDVTGDQIATFMRHQINRLSIGIQSFDDVDLKFMHRAHNAQEAERSVKRSQDKGLDNITIDLIYGSPTTTDLIWASNLSKALALDVPHISSYCLTVEEKTLLHHQIQKKQLPSLNASQAVRQFDTLIAQLTQNGYEHYEISNFARPGRHAIHNTNYWMGVPYLGLGPAAHSYDAINRSWNIANNATYIHQIGQNKLPLEIETITPESRYNEYVMTRLRTKWGVIPEDLALFDTQYQAYFAAEISGQIEKGMVQYIDGKYLLTPLGKHYADKVAMELFWVED